MAAVSVGIAGCLLTMAINYGMVVQMIDTAIATELGHLQVHAAGYTREPGIEKSMSLSFEDFAQVAALDEIEAWAPRVHGEGLASSPRTSVGVRIVGVDPKREREVSIVPASVTDGVFPAQAQQALVGEALARRLRLKVGQKIVVSVQDLNSDLTGRAYRVSGIFRTASSELNESTLFLFLGEAQRLFGLGDSVSEFALVARERKHVDQLAATMQRELGDEFEAHSWKQLRPLLVVIVQSFDTMAWYMYGAVFVAMAFGIANVLLMTVFERTWEIGVMMALGMKRPRVVALVAAESMIVTAVGLVLGFAIAGLGSFLLRGGIELGAYAESLERLGAGARLVPHLRAEDLVVPLIVAVLASLLASLWPALRAASLRPGAALRHI